MSRMRVVLLVGLTMVAATLSGCGFQPVYGDRSLADKRLNQVEIALIPDRSGQILRNYLIDRMYLNGRPDKTDYRLEIKLFERQLDLGIQKDATATRSQITISGYYTLFDSANRPVTGGGSKMLSSYNVLPSEYATLVGEQDARERSIRAIGDEIILRISIFLNSQK